MDVPARILLLPAKESPRVVILRRKPSKWVHVMLWDTSTDETEHGSWFQGNFDLWGCDLSFDGELMLFSAQSLGRRGFSSWSGVCKPPWLKTIIDTYSQGVSTGYWSAPGVLSDSNHNSFFGKGLGDWFSVFEKFFPGAFGARATSAPALPFKVEGMSWHSPVPPLPANIARRLERDGWKRQGPLAPGLGKWFIKGPIEGDPGWVSKPSSKHPELTMRFRGNVDNQGYVFGFELSGHDDLLKDASWATWTSQGDLIVARKGAIERYSLKAIQRGQPDFTFDFEDLKPPRQADRSDNK